MPKITLPKSGITGKATSATARAFGKVVSDLEIDIRKLLAKDTLSETDKLRLSNKKKQLRDVKAEMAEESGKAARRGGNRRKFKRGDQNPLLEDFEKSMAKGTKKRRLEKVRKEIEAKKNKPKTFESEKRKIMGKAMTDAGRQSELIELAKKYGRTITIAGMTFGPKTTKATGKKMMRGGMIKTGHTDMRKGGMFYNK